MGSFQECPGQPPRPPRDQVGVPGDEPVDALRGVDRALDEQVRVLDVGHHGVAEMLLNVQSEAL